MPTMQAMQLLAPRQPLAAVELPVPVAGPNQVLVRVHACGVCRTDLHIVDGELTHPKLPLVPGHQIVGTVTAAGPGVTAHRVGDRVGVPWLGWTCGVCRYCTSGRENLCDRAKFTGYDIDGGYAQFTVADERYAFALPADYPDLQAARERYGRYGESLARILALSRQNTNVLSLSVSLNEKRKATLLCQAALDALAQAVLDEPVVAGRPARRSFR